MARFPSIDTNGNFESPEVTNHIKHLVTGGAGDIRVDTSVGTRVFIGDTMIHGDTGWQRVDDLLLVEATTAAIYIRRIGNIVYLSADALRLVSGFDGATSFFEIPRGFQPDYPFRSGSGATYELNAAVYSTNDSNVDSGAALRTREDVSSGSSRFYMSWALSQPWPTSLPGR